LAYLYSPHFPYFVLVSKRGSVRLLRGVFYYWKNENARNDLILFTGDSQAQTIEGQYEIANAICEFAKQKNVKLIITIGGYRVETKDKPKVIACSHKPKLFRLCAKSWCHFKPNGKSNRGHGWFDPRSSSL
jgi:proteasome assembly chaperone (PAC2) family protein